MITVTDVKGTSNGGVFSLYGKSTDTKPTGKYMGMNIDNGSTFFEMDHQALFFYDGDTNTWMGL